MSLRRHTLSLAAMALLAVVMLALAPATAGARMVGPRPTIPDAKITTNQEFGGQPTRFTFTGQLASATNTLTPESLGQLTFVFPKGFNISDAKITVTALEGLKRSPVEGNTAKSEKRGRPVLDVTFTPPIRAGQSMLLQIHDVNTPLKGGKYVIETEGYKGPNRLSFSYKTLPRSEAWSRALEKQGWVQAWNRVKFFDLFLRPQMIVKAAPIVFAGWLISIALVGVAFPLAIPIGLMFAFAKMSKLPPLRWLAAAYINVIRGTPLFLQIFIAFIGLRIAGIRLPDFATGVIVLAANSSAYLAEIFRAGIQSIHKGQFEAASSLGMSYPQAMANVIIPQTVKRVLPTMTSEFILLFKDTALLSAVGVFELMMYSSNIVARAGNLTPFMVAAVYYLIVTIPLINWVGGLEARLAVAEGGQAASAPKRRAWWRTSGQPEPAMDAGKVTE